MEQFNAVRIETRFSHRISAPPDKVFPLLCPVRESEWLEGWDCKILYTETGRAENNCVFTTDSTGQGKRTWMVSRYELENCIVEYVVFCPELFVERIDIRVEKDVDGASHVLWRRTYTGITPKGNEFIKVFTGEPLRKRMTLVQKSLEYYLKTGEMLKEVL